MIQKRRNKKPTKTNFWILLHKSTRNQQRKNAVCASLSLKQLYIRVLAKCQSVLSVTLNGLVHLAMSKCSRIPSNGDALKANLSRLYNILEDLLVIVPDKSNLVNGNLCSKRMILQAQWQRSKLKRFNKNVRNSISTI